MQKSGLRQPCEEIQGFRKGEKLSAPGFLGGCIHFSSFTCLVFAKRTCTKFSSVLVWCGVVCMCACVFISPV